MFESIQYILIADDCPEGDAKCSSCLVSNNIWDVKKEKCLLPLNNNILDKRHVFSSNSNEKIDRNENHDNNCPEKRLSTQFCITNKEGKVYLLGKETSLTGKNLDGASLTDKDLSEMNFSKSTLLKVNLSNSNLTKADFTKVDLTGANFSNTNISGAVFSESTCPDGVKSINSCCGHFLENQAPKIGCP